MKFKTAIIGFVLLFLGPVNADLVQRAEVASFIRDMVAEYDYDADELNDVLGRVQLSEKVIAAISRPAEALPWHRYRSIFLKPGRVNGWRGILAPRIKHNLNAPKNYMASRKKSWSPLSGLKQNTGALRVAFKVIDSLSTLAFDYPKRSKFFSR